MKTKLVYRRIFSLLLVLAILISNAVNLNVFASDDDGYPLGDSAAKTRLGFSSRYLLVDNGRGSGSFNHLAVSVDGTEYPAFCIDPDVDFNADYPEYIGGNTLASSQAAKIEKMLNNAYPILTEHQLSMLWDIGEIGADEAYDITQCAIWYIVSEGGYEIPDDLLSEDGYKLYKKLISGENRAPDSIEVRMEATAATTKYSPGGCVYGPFQIAADTTSSRVNADMDGTTVDVIRGVSDSDYRFVDAGGNEVNELVIGTEYWIEYPDSGIFRANLEFIPAYQMQKASGFTQLTSVLGAELVQSVGMLTTGLTPAKGCTLETERDTGENALAVKKEMIFQDSDNILLSESGRWAGELQISDALVSGIEVELYKWNGAAWVSTGQLKTIDLSGGPWSYVKFVVRGIYDGVPTGSVRKIIKKAAANIW